MNTLLLICVALMVSVIGVPTPSPASAQLRLQETPALGGLGHLFRDVQVRFDAGVGTTATTTGFTQTTYPPSEEVWFWGIYVDKPVISTFLDMGYDLVWWEREYFARDTPERELLDAVRLVAHYRQGDFFVSGDQRKNEFYFGVRLVFDLGRFARHVPWFQR